MSDTWFIIPSANGKAWLEGCLSSLVESTPGDVPILVVDNGSTDGTIADLRSRFPRVSWLPLERNLGFARAVNLGIRAALRDGARQVVLLNNDTRFEKGWWEKFIGAANDSPEFGIIGVYQSDFEGNPSPRTAVELRRLSPVNSESMPEIVATDWAEGSCLLLRASVIEQIGYFDPLFSPAYFEEMDYCRRARRAGIGVGIAMQARIQHAGAGTIRHAKARSQHRARARVMERGYLIYHATDPARPLSRSRVVRLAIRHAVKGRLAGRLSIGDAAPSLASVLQSWSLIKEKRMRDARKHPCPLLADVPQSLEHDSYATMAVRLACGENVILKSEESNASTCSLRASVVIPVRNRSTDLKRCLEALLAGESAHRDFEVLVCDDGSPLAMAREIEEICRQVDVRYCSQPPKGPAAARNLGTRLARAGVVAFLDSDTLPEPGWLDALLAPFEDPTVVASEGPVRPPGPARSPLEEAPRNEGGAHLTANMAYRRGALETVGGLDECFPLAAFEDVDLALSVRRLGKIAFAPKALVIHPWRRMGLVASLRRVQQMDWLLVTALRHGCLGWENKPTRYPRLRIIVAALATLPMGRIRKGFSFIRQSPIDSLARIGISLLEPFAALARLPKWLATPPIPRGRYLEGMTP